MPFKKICLVEEFKIELGKKKEVKVFCNGFTIKTDQKTEDGGSASFPTPVELFLASIGACTGTVIKTFCDVRKINTESIKLTQEIFRNNADNSIIKITFKLSLPSSFPEKYKKAVLKSMNSCKVKKHLISPPEINITLT